MQPAAPSEDLPRQGSQTDKDLKGCAAFRPNPWRRRFVDHLTHPEQKPRGVGHSIIGRSSIFHVPRRSSPSSTRPLATDPVKRQTISESGAMAALVLLTAMARTTIVFVFSLSTSIACRWGNAQRVGTSNASHWNTPSLRQNLWAFMPAEPAPRRPRSAEAADPAEGDLRR